VALFWIHSSILNGMPDKSPDFAARIQIGWSFASPAVGRFELLVSLIFFSN